MTEDWEQMNIRRSDPEYEADMEGLRGLVPLLDWRSTDYYSPHAYILRGRTGRGGATVAYWDQIARAIDKYGYSGWFGSKEYVYLNIGPHRYWHYDLVLNRASHPQEVETP